jgi:hypothetical protein
LMKLLYLSRHLNLKKLRIFVSIWRLTATELLIMIIIKLKVFVRVGSGAIESTIKQIDRRLKISGAQWNEGNVSQVLKHRCAYLNAQL